MIGEMQDQIGQKDLKIQELKGNKDELENELKELKTSLSFFK